MLKHERYRIHIVIRHNNLPNVHLCVSGKPDRWALW